jgi:hypothetical protein
LGSNGFKWDLIFAESFQEQGQIALRFTWVTNLLRCLMTQNSVFLQSDLHDFTFTSHLNKPSPLNDHHIT